MQIFKSLKKVQNNKMILQKVQNIRNEIYYGFILVHVKA